MELKRGGGVSDGLRRWVAAQSAPTCIGFCRGGECASCGSSGRHWPWWLCLWPHAARCSRRGPGDRPGTCLSPLRSCRTAWSRSVARSRTDTSASGASRNMCSITKNLFCGLWGFWPAPQLCFTFIVYQFVWPNSAELRVFRPPPPPSAMFNYPGARSSLISIYRKASAIWPARTFLPHWVRR